MFARTIVLAGVYAYSTALLGQPNLEPRTNQVDLQAEVTREVPNDLMTAILYAEANDPSPAQVAERLNRLTAEAMKKAGTMISVKMRSGAMNTFPVYDRANKLTGWRGRSEIRLESKDVAGMASMIGKLQSSLQLGHVAFTVSPELRRQAENDLIGDAVAAFRNRAEVVTKALGAKSYRLRHVTIGTSTAVPPPPRPMRALDMAAASTAESAPPVFEGGTSTVQVGITGSIEVE